MALFCTALGLAVVIEGVLYAVAPGHMKRMMLHVLGSSDDALRFAGVATAAVGVAFVWAAHYFLV